MRKMNETEVCIISAYVNYNYVKNLISCSCAYTVSLSIQRQIITYNFTF